MNASLLDSHPELAPQIVGILSHTITDLKQQLQEAKAGTSASASSPDVNVLRAEIGSLQAKYETELDKARRGAELEATLEQRYIDLRLGEDAAKEKETAAKEFRRLAEEKMEAFKAETQALSQAAIVRANDLQAQLGYLHTELANANSGTRVLQQDLEAKDDALFKAHHALQKNLDVSRAQESERARELNRLQTDLTAAQAKTAELAEHFEADQASMTDLRKKLDFVSRQTATTEATHARLEDEVQTLRTTQSQAEQNLKAKQLELDETERALAAKDHSLCLLRGLDDELQTEHDALKAKSERVKEENVRVKTELSGAFEMRGRMEAQIIALQTQADDLRARAVEAEQQSHAREEQESALDESAKTNGFELRALCEKKDSELARLNQELKVKRSELRALREEKNAAEGGLKEELHVAIKAAEGENLRLKQLLTSQRIEIDQLTHTAANDKTVLTKQTAAAEEERAGLVQESEKWSLELDSVKKQYIFLEAQYNFQRLDFVRLKEASKSDKTKAIKIIERLEKTIRNLRSSVLSAGDQVKEELQKAFDVERSELKSELHATMVDNDRLRRNFDVLTDEFNGLTEHFNGLTGRFDKVTRERDDLFDRLRSLEAPPRTIFERIEGSSQSYTHELESGRSGLGKDEDETESRVEQQPVPKVVSAKEERTLYVQFMKSFRYTFDRPGKSFKFETLEPIRTLIKGNNFLDKRDIPTKRRFVYCPERIIWCNPSHRVHALAFTPTHRYNQKTDKWTNGSFLKTCSGRDEMVELFVNQGPFMYYAGTYVVHSLRDLHPPGSKNPTGVCQLAMYRATGLHQNQAEKLTECFPDGKIETECFGLQFAGFDHRLYEELRERFIAEGGSNKRKAGLEDLRDAEGTKSQRVS